MKTPRRFPKLPGMDVPLFAHGKIFLCRTQEEWAHIAPWVFIWLDYNVYA